MTVEPMEFYDGGYENLVGKASDSGSHIPLLKAYKTEKGEVSIFFTDAFEKYIIGDLEQYKHGR
jgi:hypothetical protein